MHNRRFQKSICGRLAPAFYILLIVGAGLPVQAGTGNARFVSGATGRATEGQVQVLDVMRVTAGKPAASAVLTLTLPSSPVQITCDILVAGASTGGVAAALAATADGKKVCLTEETRWIGGQMTAQGVSAFDGNRYIETTGSSRTFQEFRDGIRNYYRQHNILSARAAGERYFNPGNCWVSAICFEAPVALDVLNSMLGPSKAKGLLRIFLQTKVVKVKLKGKRITSILAYNFQRGQWLKISARFVLDATDTGELLPLAGIPYSTGAESRSQTSEPDALPGVGDPKEIQSFTYTFVLARDRGRNHRIPVPPEYNTFRTRQLYSMALDYGHGKRLTYGVFQKRPNSPGSFWAYRRLIASGNFAPPRRELSMINWPGNDYCGPGLLSNQPLKQAQALRQGKLAALGFVYWLQNEVLRDNRSGKGYPRLELMRSELGSSDGLSQFPYIRESRRIHALETIKEQQISSLYQKGPRAAPFADSVGIGLYPIDIHSCSKEDFSSATKPFELPLGALIPQGADNLIAASKDIGTTHITNGAYRLHPVEWAIGEAAGTVAAFAIDHGVTLEQVYRSSSLTSRLQLVLLQQGDPIYWYDDLKPASPSFAAAQFLAVQGIFGPDGKDLHFHPHDPVNRKDLIIALARALGMAPRASGALPSDHPAAKELRTLTRRLIRQGFLPADFSDPRKLEQRIHWRDLEMASRKFRINESFAVSTAEPDRSDFANWLEKGLRPSQRGDEAR